MIKKTGHKWFLFLVILAGFLFLLEKAFDFGLKHNLNLKSSYVATHKINAQLLILGPCEPLWMVSPEILTKETGLSCYNLAESHSDFADNYLDLQVYLQNNKAPEYLLLYVTPESFDTRYNTFHANRFATFFKEEEVSKVVAECDPSYANLKYIPFLKYGYYGHQTAFLAMQGWKHYLTNKEKPYYPDGFEPPARIVWDNHHENLKKLYPKGYSFTWDSVREIYLENILKYCSKKGVKVVLYESPILKEISDFQVNRTLFLERIEAIAAYNNCRFLKFDKVVWARDRKYFISPMVSTLEGSYLFSDTLGKALNAQFFK